MFSSYLFYFISLGPYLCVSVCVVHHNYRKSLFGLKMFRHDFLETLFSENRECVKRKTWVFIFAQFTKRMKIQMILGKL